MASGQFNGPGGLYGSYLRLAWQSYPNTAGNYSDVHVQLYLELRGGTQIIATESGDINIDGQQFTYSRGTQNRGPNGTHHVHSASRRIYHNSNGTKQIQLGGFFKSGWTTFGTINVGMSTVTLDHIPRYTSITSWSLNTVTEKSIRVSVSTANTANAVQYSLNGAGWVTGYSGNFTSRDFTIGGLNPATNYSVKIRVRRADSGLWTESGLKSATTNAVTITSLTVPNATDTGMTIQVATSHMADQLQYRRSGTSSWTSVAGDFTTKQVVITSLTANTSYTWEVRARHKDSQAYTPIQTVTASTGNPQPLQPTNLSPANGQGVGTLTPTLSWRYNSTSADSPIAFQVIIRRESTGAIVHDTGKLATSAQQHEVPASKLSFNVAYQWQVRHWSGADIEGPYSELASFKTSEAPVVTVTSPTGGETIITDAPRIDWTYADPEGAAQISYTITIKSINAPGETDGETIYTQTITNSEATSFWLPAGTLNNNSRYIALVSSTDADGVTGYSAASEFFVSFIAPPAPEIEAELSEDDLFARINVHSSKPDDDSFDTDTIRIYKREVGQNNWEYLGQVFATNNAIDRLEDATGWTTSGTASAVTANPLSKQGAASLGIQTSGSGTAQIEKSSTVGNILDYDIHRVWIYTSAVAKITSITLKFGSDASNYYSITVPKADLANDRWTSIEQTSNDFGITGTPSLGNISWTAIEVVATSAVADGELLIDNWNLQSSSDNLFIYDYRLNNKTSYEYSATAFNNRENLESDRTIIAEPINIRFDHWQNTYLVPDGDESNSLIAFTEGNDVPNWSTKTDTAYYRPVGSRVPVVYTLASQKYREGSIKLTFFDEQFGGNGLTGVRKLEQIMNHKPILIRAWWGEMLNISIDGQINIERIKGKAWTASFTFTEIE